VGDALHGVQLIVRSGEVWLKFTASDGTIAVLNISAIARKRPGQTTKSALELWCEDRLLDAINGPERG